MHHSILLRPTPPETELGFRQSSHRDLHRLMFFEYVAAGYGSDLIKVLPSSSIFVSGNWCGRTRMKLRFLVRGTGSIANSSGRLPFQKRNFTGSGHFSRNLKSELLEMTSLRLQSIEQDRNQIVSTASGDRFSRGAAQYSRLQPGCSSCKMACLVATATWSCPIVTIISEALSPQDWSTGKRVEQFTVAKASRTPWGSLEPHALT